jgi:hypothetical protein
MKRQWLNLIAGIGLVLSTAGTAAAQAAPGQGEPFTVNGTLERIVYAASPADAQQAFRTGDTSRLRAATDPQAKPYGFFLQSGATGEQTYLVVDLSWLARQDASGTVPDLKVSPQLGGQTEAISVSVRQQSDGTYLAIQYEDLAKGSMVENTNYGIREEWSTRNDSLNARVGNVPEDDEALAKQRHREKDDDKDEDTGDNLRRRR